MCSCCWSWVRNFISDYLKHVHNYTLLNWLSDLFKLFIILNYVYFAYMIFAKLWIFLNSYFEKKWKPKNQSCNTRSSNNPRCSSPSQTNCRRCSKPCGGQRGKCTKACTCHKPTVLPPQESLSRCSTAATLEFVQNSFSKLFSKPDSSPCEKKRSNEKNKRSCDKRTLDSQSSYERIQVEFNCKTKKPRKTRDGNNKVPKSRSCTKCGKNMSVNNSRCGLMSRSYIGPASRKLACPK